jgi:alpha-beta hydrolase superfamily lysophospholipase
VKDGVALVAYKGTDPTNLVDLDADAAIALGTQRYNPQFRNAITIAHRANEKYGSVYTTGHSLGGIICINLY